MLHECPKKRLSRSRSCDPKPLHQRGYQTILLFDFSFELNFRAEIYAKHGTMVVILYYTVKKLNGSPTRKSQNIAAFTADF